MAESNETIWETALSALAGRIQPHNFDMWLRPLSCRLIEGSRVLAPNDGAESEHRGFPPSLNRANADAELSRDGDIVLKSGGRHDGIEGLHGS